jgi:hypothetical protein
MRESLYHRDTSEDRPFKDEATNLPISERDRHRQVGAPAHRSKPPTAKAMRQRIAPGTYVADCIGFKDRGAIEGKLYLQLLIAEGKASGVEVSKPMNYKEGDMGHATVYFRLWALATGRCPIEGEELRPEVFVGKRYEITVRDVVRDSKGRPKLEYLSIQSLMTWSGLFQSSKRKTCRLGKTAS